MEELSLSSLEHSGTWGCKDTEEGITNFNRHCHSLFPPTLLTIKHLVEFNTQSNTSLPFLIFVSIQFYIYIYFFYLLKKGNFRIQFLINYLSLANLRCVKKIKRKKKKKSYAAPIYRRRCIYIWNQFCFEFLWQVRKFEKEITVSVTVIVKVIKRLPKVLAQKSGIGKV